MKIKEIVSALEQFAPLPLQDGFDNAGLQIGLTEVEVTGALLCLDVTEAVIDEAVASGANLIVSHHPLIFHACKSIAGRNYVERCIMKAIKNDVAIYSAHTNLDNAPQGVNFKIAEKIGLKNVRILEEREQSSGGKETAGAGVIGELERPETEMEFLRRMKGLFQAGCLKHTEPRGKEIRTVAVCGGAGAFLIPVAIARQADVFLTGEIKYHDYFGRETDILLAEIGHYESEQYTKELLYDMLRGEFPDLPIRMTGINTNPIKYL